MSDEEEAGSRQTIRRCVNLIFLGSTMYAVYPISLRLGVLIYEQSYSSMYRLVIQSQILKPTL